MSEQQIPICVNCSHTHEFHVKDTATKIEDSPHYEELKAINGQYHICIAKIEGQMYRCGCEKWQPGFKQ